jgi:hypothetical protein
LALALIASRPVGPRSSAPSLAGPAAASFNCRSTSAAE